MDDAGLLDGAGPLAGDKNVVPPAAADDPGISEVAAAAGKAASAALAKVKLLPGTTGLLAAAHRIDELYTPDHTTNIKTRDFLRFISMSAWGMSQYVTMLRPGRPRG